MKTCCSTAPRREGRAHPTPTPAPTSPRSPNALVFAHDRPRRMSHATMASAAASAVRRAPRRSPARPSSATWSSPTQMGPFCTAPLRPAPPAPGDYFSSRSTCGRTWASLSQGETWRRLGMMAGSSAQSPSMASTAEEPLGGVAQRRWGLLCVLSTSSLLSHADTPPGRRFSISAYPPTILLPDTALDTDLVSRRQLLPHASCTSTSTCASATRSPRAAHLCPLDRERTHGAPASEATAEADTPLSKHAEPAAPAASSLFSSSPRFSPSSSPLCPCRMRR
jgi:hypothetical protein